MSNPAPVQPMRRMGSSNVGISNGSEAQSSLLEYMYRYGNSFSPSGTEYSVGVWPRNEVQEKDMQPLFQHINFSEFQSSGDAIPATLPPNELPSLG